MKKILLKEHRKVVSHLKKLIDEGEFYLAGGTALYYYLDHRKSMDLDLFTEKKIDLRDFKEFFRPEELEIITTDTIHAKVFNVDISFFYFPYPLLKKLVNFDLLKMSSVEDILCMKINAIISRGSRKDFVDIYFIMKKYKINSETAINLFKKKFGEYNELLIRKAMTYFEDAEKEPEFPMIKKANWGQIKKFLIKKFIWKNIK